MCSCTRRRNSAISFCAAFDSVCVSVNDVSPCISVAASTTPTSIRQLLHLVFADDVVHQELRGRW